MKKHIPFGYAMFALAVSVASMVWAIDYFVVAPFLR